MEIEHFEDKAKRKDNFENDLVKLRNVLFGILACVIASFTRRMPAIIGRDYDDCRSCTHNNKYRNIRESIVFFLSGVCCV